MPRRFSSSSFANMPQESKMVAVGLVAVILILSVVSLLLNRQFSRDAQIASEVSRSYHERDQVLALLSLHQQMETSQRGFVLTGDTAFLEPYRSAEPRIWKALANVQEITSRNPSLEQDVRALGELTKRKVAFSRKTIALRQNGSRDEADRLIGSGEGKALMDDIGVRLARVQKFQQSELERRTDEVRASRRATQFMTFILLATLLAFLIGAGLLAVRSINAERAARKRLADLSARQVAIFECATDGMITHDDNGIIETFNPAAAKMYGYRPDELTGQNVRVLFGDPPSQEDLEKALRRLSQTSTGPAARVQEYKARRADGSTFDVDVVTSPVKLADSSCFIAVIRDATDRKRVDRMKSEFVATVSHELRTPLTAIGGSLGLLAAGAAGELPERARRLIGIAHSNSERLVRLINDILDIEKMESGEMELRLETLHLNALAEQAIGSNAAFADEYGVVMRFERAEGDPLVRADADRLMQVLTNLLSNAAKFSPRGEEVVLSVTAGKAMHRITVTDRGPGIPEEFKERIFSKFAQADSSDTRQKGGTGLGLSIVREIITRLGGRVSYESAAGHGASFHVELPPVETHADRVNKRRILIGQRDSSSARELRKMLQLAGYEADVATTVEELRTMVEAQAYAAILLDFGMDHGDPKSFIHQLRSDPRSMAIPIIVGTPGDAGGNVSQALAVVDWIHKPVPVEKLIRGVDAAVFGKDLPRILHVEDDEDVLRVVASAFEGRSHLVAATDLEQARDALRGREFDLVILDLALPGGSGLDLLPELTKRDGAPIPVVIFTARDDDPQIARQVEAMLTKSKATLNDLVAAVEKTVGQRKSV